MTTLVDLSQDIKALKPDLVALRRELHQHPELAFEEVWTAATLAGRMRALGLAVQEGVGGTGVLVVLEGAKPGKTLLIRADMDALPMVETTGRAYASKLENRNHSCGHDAHAAIVAGVAEVLVPQSRPHRGASCLGLPASGRAHARCTAYDRRRAAGAGQTRYVAERARATDSQRRPGCHPAWPTLGELGHGGF